MGLSTRHQTLRIDLAHGVCRSRPDLVVVEEPLELRIGSTPLTVTMRTPGHDVEWVHGFLHGEGVIASREDVLTARYCAGSVVDDEHGIPVNTYNVIEVLLAEHVPDPIATG